MGGGSDIHIAMLRAVEATKVATLSPYHTTRPRRRLANDGNNSRSWLTQLVPSIGAILLTVTSQGQQNALQKSRPAHIGQWRHCAYSVAMLLCIKSDLSFNVNIAGFCRDSHNFGIYHDIDQDDNGIIRRVYIIIISKHQYYQDSKIYYTN